MPHTTFPNITKAAELMASCNGAMHRLQPEGSILRSLDRVLERNMALPADNDLVAVEQWLGTLNEDDLFSFVDGDEPEMFKVAETGPLFALDLFNQINEAFP